MKKIFLAILVTASVQAMAQGSFVPQDISRFIDSGADNPSQKLALKQAAAVINMAANDPLNNPANIQALVNGVAASKMCLNSRYPESGAEDKFAMIEKMILNDPKYFLAYQNFKAVSMGLTAAAPQAQGCAFYGS